MIENHLPDEVHKYSYPGCAIRLAGISIVLWLLILAAIKFIADKIF